MARPELSINTTTIKDLTIGLTERAQQSPGKVEIRGCWEVTLQQVEAEPNVVWLTQ